MSLSQNEINLFYRCEIKQKVGNKWCVSCRSANPMTEKSQKRNQNLNIVETGRRLTSHICVDILRIGLSQLRVISSQLRR